MNRNKILLVLGLGVLLVGKAAAQHEDAAAAFPGPDSRFKADLLLVVAHPDDETAVGSYLARLVYDEARRVAVVYCTRGTGGGNSAGNEQSTAMGLEREVEARRAVASFGIFNVWFLDGIDTPGQDVLQSLARWGHGLVLEELVRVVRLTQAEVIVTWLPHVVAGENHGDHQASGVLATEAFDVAGDPTVYPSQVAVPRERADIGQLCEGLAAWQPKKIYYVSDASHALDAPGPAFDLRERSPRLGMPYYRAAASLDTFHLTQGDVATGAREAIASGSFDAFIRYHEKFKLIFGKSHVKGAPTDPVFSGIAAAPAPFAPCSGYRPEIPQGVTLELGGAWAFYRDFWRAHDIDHLRPLVRPELEVASGSYVHIPLIIRNETPEPVTVSLTAELPQGWKLSSGAARYRLAPHEAYPVQTFAFAPGDPRERFENIVWKAEAGGSPPGAVTIRVKVSEWTLPE